VAAIIAIVCEAISTASASVGINILLLATLLLAPVFNSDGQGGLPNRRSPLRAVAILNLGSVGFMLCLVSGPLKFWNSMYRVNISTSGTLEN